MGFYLKVIYLNYLLMPDKYHHAASYLQWSSLPCLGEVWQCQKLYNVQSTFSGFRSIRAVPGSFHVDIRRWPRSYETP